MRLLRNDGKARLLLLALFLLGPVLGHAQNREPPLQARFPDVAPWSVSGEPGKPGIHAELLAELARRLGTPIQAKPMVYARLPVQLSFRDIDIAVALDSAPMDTAGIRVGPLLPTSTVVVGRQPLPDVRSLSGKTIAMVRGTWYDSAINDNPDIKKYEITNINQGVRMVSRGHLDAVVGTSYAIAYGIYICGEDPKRFAAPLLINKVSFWVYARRDMPPEQIARLRDALADMNKAGVRDPIVARYIGM